jgi:hypothetical protein
MLLSPNDAISHLFFLIVAIRRVQYLLSAGIGHDLEASFKLTTKLSTLEEPIQKDRQSRHF